MTSDAPRRATPLPWWRGGKLDFGLARVAWRGAAWLQYGLAILLTVAVVRGRLALNPWWGEVHNRHLVFFPAVMVSALFGGFGPGLVSTTICSGALAWFWTGAGGRPTISFDTVLFFGTSVAICALIHSLRLARVRAEEARRSRERVMEAVAHDLRNPLSSIKIVMQLLHKDSRDGDSLNRRLASMNGAVSRMENLIRDLVDMTRIEHGELKVSCAPIDAVALLRECAEIHAPLALEKQIAIVVEAPATAPLQADSERLLQALGNLVGNALKFTREGGSVTLRLQLQLPGGWARFEVSDTGSGIAAADLPHVFEAYWKGDQGGTGLGLFIAAEIVRAHGGRISAHSEPGQGARFAIEIPARAAA
jgi:signal transduction histidine kinase